MAGVERFEDLIAWQKARVLTRAVYKITRAEDVRRDYGFATQLQRASISVMSNIAEGFERQGPAEFQQFLAIAKASCAEVRSLIYVGYDARYLDEAGFRSLLGLAEEVARLIGALRASAMKRRHMVKELPPPPTQYSALSTQYSVLGSPDSRPRRTAG
jgi:four helix bundle protein